MKESDKSGLKINLSTCLIYYNEVKYLGYIINEVGIEIKNILEYPRSWDNFKD